MLPQALAIINGKGGTGKTSLTANLAAIFAADGYRVLAVDWDPQGNLSRDLGYHDAESNDNGATMVAALAGEAELAPIPGVRERLDVIAGGEALEDTEVGPDALGKVLAPLAQDYDLIVLDCPPGNRHLQRAALVAAHFVVIPTRHDAASIDGLTRVARLFAAIRTSDNPDLELLGVMLFDIGSQSRKIMRDVREQLAAMFGRDDAAFLSSIRHVEGPPADCRALGKVVHELDRELYAQMMVSGPQLTAKGGPRRFSPSTPGLAGDYQRFASEVAERMAAAAERAAS